ncbi:MAG: ACT domain-containing protein [Candidatus Omnitrophica bacterium]|nr:ACT domain-containing protein [Candidatus Omnitrophota bacterium]
MEKVEKRSELKVIVKDRVGATADIAKLISERGVNIEDICVYTMGGDAIFYLITQDNSQMAKIISDKGYKVEEREVVVMSLENRPGALQKVAEKLKEENIDIKYLYGTMSGKGENTTLVFSSNNNEKAIEVLKYILSLSGWGR